MVSEVARGYSLCDVRNPNVDKIHLLKRITLELKEIQTLQRTLTVIQRMLGIIGTDIT
jgi:hypothetical protein